MTLKMVTLQTIDERLDHIARQVDVIARVLAVEGKLIMAALDDLTTQVAANTSAEASAILLIQGLAKEIADSASDTTKVQALAAQLKASGDALAAAVVANTPVAPAPATPPAAPEPPPVVTVT